MPYITLNNSFFSPLHLKKAASDRGDLLLSPQMKSSQGFSLTSYHENIMKHHTPPNQSCVEIEILTSCYKHVHVQIYI